MGNDDVLRECLSVHRQLLKVEQDLHRWLNEMTGVEPAADKPAS